MRIWVLLLLLGANAAAAGADAARDYRRARPVYRVQKSESGRMRFEHHAAGSLLRIVAGDCARVDSEQAALAEWNRRRGRDVKPARCECAPGADCAADASALIPPEFRSQFNTAVASDGPNCWNASLRAAGLIRAFRHSTEAELRWYLGSSACRELDGTEAAEAGDLIAIRSPDAKIVHAFTYLSPEISLSKNGYIHAQPLLLAAPGAVFGDPLYQTRPECRRVRSDSVPKACRAVNRATYHRCSPQKAEFLRRPSSDPQIRLVEALIRQQERLVSDWVQDGLEARTPLALDQLGPLEAALRRELVQLNLVRDFYVSDPIERQRVQALCYVLSSLLETVHYLKGGRWSPEQDEARKVTL